MNNLNKTSVFYNTGYLNTNTNLLREKQGLPSHNLANSCIGYKECNEHTMYPFNNVTFDYGVNNTNPNCPCNF